jgi:CheY-like chemotaxis protein
MADQSCSSGQARRVDSFSARGSDGYQGRSPAIDGHGPPGGAVLVKNGRRGIMAGRKPLAEESSMHQTNDPPSKARLPSILIVDDSLDSANTLGILLARHGYEIHVAYEWSRAFETAKSRLPDIILLDLAMPEMDGIHLARLFRDDEQLRSKLIIAVTGYADDMHREQCEAAGIVCILSKPVAWTDLEATINRHWSMRNS